MALVKICRAGDIKEGEGKVVRAGDIEIAVFNEGGNLYAIDNACPHRKGPLGEGMLDGDVVTCPWHGWRFNVKTGKSATMPVAVKTHQLKIENGDVYVDL